MLNTRSWDNLVGVDPRLAAVAASAALRGPRYFVVTEGLRSLERQRMLFRQGHTWTLNSRHLSGKAFDVAILEGSVAIWDVAAYRELWEWQIRPAAAELGVLMEWGGSWKQVDAVHFELV